MDGNATIVPDAALASGGACLQADAAKQKCIRSANKRFFFCISPKGGLAAFDCRDQFWSVAPAPTVKPFQLCMQADANLVARDGAGVAYWTSNTKGKGPAPLQAFVSAKGGFQVGEWQRGGDGTGKRLWLGGAATRLLPSWGGTQTPISAPQTHPVAGLKRSPTTMPKLNAPAQTDQGQKLCHYLGLWRPLLWPRVTTDDTSSAPPRLSGAAAPRSRAQGSPARGRLRQPRLAAPPDVLIAQTNGKR